MSTDVTCTVQEMQQNQHLPTGFCLWILLVQCSSSYSGYYSLIRTHLSSLLRCCIGEGSMLRRWWGDGRSVWGPCSCSKNGFPSVKGCCRGGWGKPPRGSTHTTHTPPCIQLEGLWIGLYKKVFLFLYCCCWFGLGFLSFFVCFFLHLDCLGQTHLGE